MGRMPADAQSLGCASAPGFLRLVSPQGALRTSSNPTRPRLRRASRAGPRGGRLGGSAGASTLASRSPTATSASWPRCTTSGEPPPQPPALALARTVVHALRQPLVPAKSRMTPGCQPHPRPCPRGKGAGLWGARDIGSLESCSLKQQQQQQKFCLTRARGSRETLFSVTFLFIYLFY